MYYWFCSKQDIRHGCFHADYNGRCEARSRKGYKTEKEALKAGEKHRCRFNGYGCAGSIQVMKIHGNSYYAKHWRRS